MSFVSTVALLLSLSGCRGSRLIEIICGSHYGDRVATARTRETISAFPEERFETPEGRGTVAALGDRIAESTTRHQGHGTRRKDSRGGDAQEGWFSTLRLTHELPCTFFAI